MSNVLTISSKTFEKVISGEPKISVNGRSGLIGINIKGREFLNDKRKFTFHHLQDEKTTYLQVDDEAGFTFRGKEKWGLLLSFKSLELQLKKLNNAPQEGVTHFRIVNPVDIIINENSITVYPLILIKN